MEIKPCGAREAITGVHAGGTISLPRTGFVGDDLTDEVGDSASLINCRNVGKVGAGETCGRTGGWRMPPLQGRGCKHLAHDAQTERRGTKESFSRSL